MKEKSAMMRKMTYLNVDSFRKQKIVEGILMHGLIINMQCKLLKYIIQDSIPLVKIIKRCLFILSKAVLVLSYLLLVVLVEKHGSSLYSPRFVGSRTNLAVVVRTDASECGYVSDLKDSEFHPIQFVEPVENGLLDGSCSQRQVPPVKQ